MVTVKTMEEITDDDFEEIMNKATYMMRKATGGYRGQMITKYDSIEYWVAVVTRDRYAS